jgi:Phage integrase family
MHVKLRYVERRIDRSGGERWYWHRRGHKLTRLPNVLTERIVMAEQLNAAADKAAPVEFARGSIAWVIRRYQHSDEYNGLSPGTVKYYKRFLGEIGALGPALPFASFTRRAVVDFIETYAKPHQRRQATAVLKNLFGIARYYGIVTTDEAAGLRLKTTPPRDRIWTDGENARWLEDAAAGEDPHMTTAFLLLQYTAQRPSDVLKMIWPHYSGSAIRVRQQKTGALLDVPIHPVLREHLDTLARSSTSLTIVTYRGRPVKYLRFNERFRRISKRVQIDAQARDLRRTAMVRMAEAGATVPQIASVSGHSIEATQRILETYLPRNRDLAEIAITRLAEYKKRTESNALDKG